MLLIIRNTCMTGFALRVTVIVHGHSSLPASLPIKPPPVLGKAWLVTKRSPQVFFQPTVLGIRVDLCFSLVRPTWKLMSETSAACVGRLWREAQRDSKFRNCGDTLDFASAVAPSARTH